LQKSVSAWSVSAIARARASGAAGVDGHNHFNLERHPSRRETFKQNGSAALSEWRQIAA
tara:strand:+ start:1229 stop:1405 length:177 start_codon:yes stop_codon:yes gene_type:complete